MAPSPLHPLPRPNRAPHHNRTTHAAFTNTVRNALDAPLPPTPPSPSLLSPSSSSTSSSSSNLPQFRNSAPLPHRGNAVRPSTPNAYSAPPTPPSPYARSVSPGTSSPATSLLDDETPRREYILPISAFANARESPPSSHSLYHHPDPRTDEEVMTIRPSPARTIASSSHPSPFYLQNSQSANFRRPSALPPPTAPSTTPTPSLPKDLENLYHSIGIILTLPSSSPRDHLSSIEAMNDAIAVWAASNPVVGMHIAALAGRLGVRGRYEGTLALGGTEEWMLRRGLSKRDGKGASFRERVRRMGAEGAAAGAVRRGGQGWRDLPLVVVLLYSEVCGMDLTRMVDREARAMLGDWATRFWPVNDEAMVGVMMEWGSERTGKVDIDPRRSIREDAGGVERVIERMKELGGEEVRRGGSLLKRLAGGARRSGSVRTGKK